MKQTLLFLLTNTLLVFGDVYLHNPRGNNNRCDERSNNRNNANRLFDSQNNAAGGYAITCNRLNNDNINCYNMNYYTNTIIPITWTSQHNCGENNDCQFIIQYACEDELGKNVRDGRPQNINGNTCTQRIPEESDESLVGRGESTEKYGVNEDYSYYKRCKSRRRNPHLFTADQKLKGKSAIYTRQNPNGNRYGFECPEERDYYPYWSETDWVDVAVLTTNTSRCDYYSNNSRCNVDKYECIGSDIFAHNMSHCEDVGGLWVKYSKFSGCNFTCEEAPTSVINRLGLGVNSSGHTTFYWKLPSVPKNKCVLRLRYNISTKETPWEFTNLNNRELRNNPVHNTSQNIPVRLAINTAQYSRVFEDRTYTFNIINRPVSLVNKTIHNVNVAGKRGNIAQVRNCIEYDFIPNNLLIHENEYIHFQFIGSDYNPQGNDGEGRAGTDRSNIVLIENHKTNIPLVNNNVMESIQLFSDEIMMSLATIGQNITDNSQCFNYTELTIQNKRNDQQSLKNCALLNAAEPYFNMSPVRPNKNGTMIGMSSRNNNFSNRGQKLKIVVLASNSSSMNITSNVSLSTEEEDNNKSETDKEANMILGISLGLIVFFLILIVTYLNKEKLLLKIKGAKNIGKTMI